MKRELPSPPDIPLPVLELDLYSQAIDESKLAAQRDIALAIAGTAAAD